MTPRQGEVWTLILRGKPYKEVARDLGIRLDTVKNHMHAIHKACGASSSAEMVALYWEAATAQRDRMIASRDDRIVVLEQEVASLHSSAARHLVPTL
jgi:DNA-binding CsgD family transcriptional regulator